ncbi:NADH dehydrogenase [ubiquinone] 1 beta subcomplex subunit 2 isoform X3 [Nymphaea colorata]|uniref:NADH dehydrogenase [ubiquinone] 1 beta subcomplex subunit 2 isoform X3 n=1 Tax=Nymphaea colorata TaxID=210225 RepID=UPI00129E0131|nr:NADH dehydrogenase [ubiquinone] 1 beta subcomplex subunit 2 isoform X3 [Nymphaea colorata]
MGGGHGDGHGVTYKGLTLYPPKRWHVVTGKGLCAVMWFWVLYRAKQDGPVLLGWRRPWEGHEDHEDDHEHAHSILIVGWRSSPFPLSHWRMETQSWEQFVGRISSGFSSEIMLEV